VVLFARGDQQFHFVRSAIVVFDTHRRLSRPEELVAALPTMSVGSIFYHFIDARRRTKGCRRLSGLVERLDADYSALSDALAETDPYFDSLYSLKARLGTLFESYFLPRSNLRKRKQGTRLLQVWPQHRRNNCRPVISDSDWRLTMTDRGVTMAVLRPNTSGQIRPARRARRGRAAPPTRRAVERPQVVHVNSTRQGGGVAEILEKLVPLMQELGIDASWEVIEGNEDFFACTKGFTTGSRARRSISPSGSCAYTRGQPANSSASGRYLRARTSSSSTIRSLRPCLCTAATAAPSGSGGAIST